MVPYMTADQVRRAFLDFYGEKDHQVIPSFPVVSHTDPTTLFVNSGMMPLKHVFLGDNPQNYKRICNSQKVLRVSGKHNDLDEVGTDDYHHTFFEMLGHWSFGDYFKKETIRWGWQLMTEVYQLCPSRLFVTVHHNDHEAKQLWLEETDVRPDHVLSFAEDNFWTMGPVGPCGYCSEIHYDRAATDSQVSQGNQTKLYRSSTRGVNSGDARYMELINFVFMDQERKSDGSVEQLPQKHIDTGAGLERICSVVQGVKSAYETDLLRPLVEKIADFTRHPYDSGIAGIPHRILADHLRAVCFALADGVAFDRVGRGYVIRRILRRAERFAHKLGVNKPFLVELFPTLVEMVGDAYPEIREKQTFIHNALLGEETQFLKTLDGGMSRLNQELEACGGTELSGEVVFSLHDTYGFPVDLTRQVAAEQGITVDEEGFKDAMERQRQRAQQSQKFQQGGQWHELSGGNDSEFCGYETLTARLSTIRYRVITEEGRELYEFVFDQTPFYPTSGGQLGDRGVVKNSQITFVVLSTYKEHSAIVHRCVREGSGEVLPHMIKEFRGEVDAKVRKATVRHHSATHLLHSALRAILGNHVFQRGSYCDDKFLRFDFSHSGPLSPDQMDQIETWVNKAIRAAHGVCITEQSFEEAVAEGALSMAGESYDSKVRVLTMGREEVVSKELCGGTHVQCTGQIGWFVLASDSSIASGTRRVVAYAGEPARQWMQQKRGQLRQIWHLLDGKDREPEGDKVLLKVRGLLDQHAELKKKAKENDAASIHQLIADLFRGQLPTAHGAELVVADLTGKMPEGQHKAFLESLAVKVAAESVVAFCWTIEKKNEKSAVSHSDGGELYDLRFFCAVSPKLAGKWHAGKLLSSLARRWQGKGGGRPDRAQGGAQNVRLPEGGGQIAKEVRKVLDDGPPSER